MKIIIRIVSFLSPNLQLFKGVQHIKKRNVKFKIITALITFTEVQEGTFWFCSEKYQRMKKENSLQQKEMVKLGE